MCAFAFGTYFQSAHSTCKLEAVGMKYPWKQDSFIHLINYLLGDL